MLSCHDLDGFTDKLCDLTREMPAIERAQEAGELLVMVEQVPQRFLMQWRAAAVADLHYLDGQSLRGIAEQLGRSFQGVSAWLRDYGPTHYLSLIKDGDQAVRPALVAVDGEQTKAKIRQYRTAGRVIVPAVENLVVVGAPGGVPPGTNLGALWERLTRTTS